MARTYGPIYAEIWGQALRLPGYDDLLFSLAAEFAIKFGGTPEEAARELEDCWNRRWEVIGSAFRGSGSAEEVTSYYEEADHGIAISLYWHSLRADRYALHSVAGLNTVQEFSEGRRVFEFGHGVGSTGILFARHGFEVVLGDVSKPYREFAARRFADRDLAATFVDLMVEEPQPDSFDAIVSFDVLEHLPDPLAAVKRMRRWLKPGGVLVMNVAFGISAENPEHLLARRRGFVDRIRALGFERIPSPTLLVFYKAESGRSFRMAYRVVDLVDATAADILASVPRLGRLTRPTRLPSV